MEVNTPAPRRSVVDPIAELIRFDTSNTGEPETTKGRRSAHWVADQLAEAGYETTTSSPVSRAGATFSRACRAIRRARRAPCSCTATSTSPAEAADWSVHPFSGAIADGYIWGAAPST